MERSHSNGWSMSSTPLLPGYQSGYVGVKSAEIRVNREITAEMKGGKIERNDKKGEGFERRWMLIKQHIGAKTTL